MLWPCLVSLLTSSDIWFCCFCFCIQVIRRGSENSSLWWWTIKCMEVGGCLHLEALQIRKITFYHVLSWQLFQCLWKATLSCSLTGSKGVAFFCLIKKRRGKKKSLMTRILPEKVGLKKKLHWSSSLTLFTFLLCFSPCSVPRGFT